MSKTGQKTLRYARNAAIALVALSSFAVLLNHFRPKTESIVKEISEEQKAKERKAEEKLVYATPIMPDSISPALRRALLGQNDIQINWLNPSPRNEPEFREADANLTRIFSDTSHIPCSIKPYTDWNQYLRSNTSIVQLDTSISIGRFFTKSNDTSGTVHVNPVTINLFYNDLGRNEIIADLVHENTHILKERVHTEPEADTNAALSRTVSERGAVHGQCLYFDAMINEAEKKGDWVEAANLRSSRDDAIDYSMFIARAADEEKSAIRTANRLLALIGAVFLVILATAYSFICWQDKKKRKAGSNNGKS